MEGANVFWFGKVGKSISNKTELMHPSPKQHKTDAPPPNKKTKLMHPPSNKKTKLHLLQNGKNSSYHDDDDGGGVEDVDDDGGDGVVEDVTIEDGVEDVETEPFLYWCNMPAPIHVLYTSHISVFS